MQNKLKTVAADCFIAIEKDCGIQLGELGMDMVFDAKRDVYTLEANTKPGQLWYKKKSDYKNMKFSDPGFNDVALAMDLGREVKLLEYAEYLHLES